MTQMDHSQTSQLVFNIHGFSVYSLKNFEKQVKIESLLYCPIFFTFSFAKNTFHSDEMIITKRKFRKQEEEWARRQFVAFK